VAYSTIAASHLPSYVMLQHYVLLQGCYKGVTRFYKGVTRVLPSPREGIIGILAMERATCVLVGGREDTGSTPSGDTVLSPCCHSVVTVLL
jgi:hypothetical protein